MYSNNWKADVSQQNKDEKCLTYKYEKGHIPNFEFGPRPIWVLVGATQCHSIFLTRIQSCQSNPVRRRSTGQKIPCWETEVEILYVGVTYQGNPFD